MITTKRLGNTSEAKVLAALVAAGYPVLVPFGDNERYDLVVELSTGTFSRIQVKTAFVTDNGDTIEIPVCSSHNHVNAGKKAYHNEVDFIMAYYPGNDKVYKLDINDVGTSSITLRLTPAKNNNPRCRYAVDYEL